MAARGKFRFGYRATLTDEGRRGYVLVQRDLGPTEVARLEQDLRRLSAGIVRVSTVFVDFDVPLSRAMSVALFELSQKLELPMTLSVPPLAVQQQASLGNDFIETSGRFFRIELRSGTGTSSPRRVPGRSSRDSTASSYVGRIATRLGMRSRTSS